MKTTEQKIEAVKQWFNRSPLDGDCKTVEDYCKKVADRMPKLYGDKLECPTLSPCMML